jgi:gamma-glutamylcyclotransferase
MDGTEAVYFAYGSNMHSTRMRTRVDAARLRGVARLADMRLVFDKLGRDGSAKANLSPAPGVEVWGVVWCLPLAAWTHLDRFEGGYRRIAVEVELADGRLRAETYVSRLLAHDPRPLASYLGWIRDGAREHGLPAGYVAQLERVVALPDGPTACQEADPRLGRADAAEDLGSRS